MEDDAVVVADDDTDVAAPLPSPTPAVVEDEAGAPLPTLPLAAHLLDEPRMLVRDGDALAFVSAFRREWLLQPSGCRR